MWSTIGKCIQLPQMSEERETVQENTDPWPIGQGHGKREWAQDAGGEVGEVGGEV